jgi:NAD(P)-dependent dehydrogenase (short-subunit alcohol dehydrogenase family)
MGLEQFSLADRTAIVTGASYGLGVRFATTLAEAGANVVLAARSADKLADTAAKVEALGVKVLVQPCDVTDPAAVKAVVAATWDTFGRADVLVNNAGAVAEAGMVPERIPDELFATTVATNLNGLFTFCREVGSRQLADGRGGSIVNVASVAGLGAQPHFPSAYQASKAAVINLTRNLGASWAKRGVRVNALCPGWFPSEMTAPFFAMPAYWSRVVAMTPMARAGLEHELDGALLFLASDASSFMTGATLAIDGGLTSTVGAVDYDDDMFLTLETVVGELGTTIRPTAGSGQPG